MIKYVVSLYAMNLFFTSIFILFSLKVHADVDLNFGMNYRFYPQAATVESTIGYGQLLWGSSSDALYGFIRATATVEGITDYFSKTATLEMFPLSIIGVRFGKSWIENHKDYSAYNCVNYLCRGDFTSQFLEVPFFAELWRFVLIASWRSEQWQVTDSSAKTNQTEYVEPTSGLPLLITYQREIQRKRVAVLYKLNEHWRIGVTEMQYEGEPLGEGYKNTYARMRTVFTQFQVKDILTSEDQLSLFFGVGEFYSKLALTDPTFFLGLSFSPISKLGY